MANEMGNGKILEEDKPAEPSFLVTAFHTIVDILVFIVVSIGYIIQDLYFIAFGYPEKDLKGEIALVTGGGSGIGRILATRLAEMGSKVVIWDINQEGINETVKMVQSMGGICKGYNVDISKKEQVYKAADVVRNELGDVTLLINNAGVVSGRLLLDTPDYLIERSFDVNVMAHFWTTKAFLPRMMAKDYGHIVTIASLAGQVGISKLVDYCGSKFGAVGFDESLRMELEVLGYDNIQTTCVCPFFIQQTGMFEDVNARWIPTLGSDYVAERILKAIKQNEKLAVIPGYVKILLALKWIFPWGVASGFLRRLVPDAAPTHPEIKYPQTEISKEHQSKIDDIPKSASILVQRTSSMNGERVL